MIFLLRVVTIRFSITIPCENQDHFSTSLFGLCCQEAIIEKMLPASKLYHIESRITFKGSDNSKKHTVKLRLQWSWKNDLRHPPYCFPTCIRAV